MSALEVISPGPLALVQDLGRPGLADLGVGRSGAADRTSLRLANRLLANDDDAAAIEVTLGGLKVRAVNGDVMLCLTGAPAAATIGGTTVAHRSVLALRQDQTLSLAAPATGLRTYLAVRGGIDVPLVLGSRSTDTMSGIGPEPLKSGVILPIGQAPTEFPNVDSAAGAEPSGGIVRLRAIRGPRDDWAEDVQALASTEWTVSSRSNRVGMRLEGTPLKARWSGGDARELPSEGVVRGAIQMPAGGAPVLFLADHPVTGGYPVIAVVIDADVDLAAQVRPGQQVRFRLLDPPEGRQS